MDSIQVILRDSLPEVIGGLVVTALLAIGGLVAARLRRGRTQPDARELVHELLEDRLANRFDIEGRLARTEDDEAGLALISAIIDRKADRCIDVIGRGSQWVDRRTREYITAVAKAILRGVEYNRILILDAELVENGLVWLLLLERFTSQPSYRGRVALYPVRMQQSQSLMLQFQLVDETYLHSTNRHYSSNEPGALRRAHSHFTIGPHAEVVEKKAVFRQHLTNQGPPLSHREIVDLIEELLTTTNPHQYAIRFHWQLAVRVVRFLDELEVPGLPKRGLEFVGSLMPFTFTFEAARRFCAARQGSARVRPAVVMPFERLDDAMRLFQEGVIDHICVPVENTKVDQITPPTMSLDAIENLRTDYIVSGCIEIEVSFVLAGLALKGERPSQLAAVDSAYEQVLQGMKKRTRNLARVPEPPQSNYHAAWIASQDKTVIAITTQAAADFLGLRTYKVLKDREKNVTLFNVFSHRR